MSATITDDAFNAAWSSYKATSAVSGLPQATATTVAASATPIQFGLTSSFGATAATTPAVTLPASTATINTTSSGFPNLAELEKQWQTGVYSSSSLLSAPAVASGGLTFPVSSVSAAGTAATLTSSSTPVSYPTVTDVFAAGTTTTNVLGSSYPTFGSSFPTFASTTAPTVSSVGSLAYPTLTGATTTAAAAAAYPTVVSVAGSVAPTFTGSVVGGSTFAYPTATTTAAPVVSGSTWLNNGLVTDVLGSVLSARGLGAAYPAGVSVNSSFLPHYGHGVTVGETSETVPVGEEIINISVRVPVLERRTAPVVERYVHVPYPVEPKVIPIIQPVQVLQVQTVEKDVVQVVEKEVEKIEEVEKVVERLIYTCFGCGGEIRDNLFEGDGRRWHQQCYILCAGCGRWIRGEVFEAEGRAWHRGCFITCAGCGGWIESDAFQAEGRWWHREHYLTCFGCGQWIERDAFQAEGRWWHREHYLTCAACGGWIERDAFQAEGRWWHREHYITCNSCGGWIESNVFEALGAKWHYNCFTCVKCGKTCGDSFVVHEGHAAHQACLKPAGPPGMAMRQTINVKTLAEAERLDAMDGVVDGKYNGTAIACPDPEWQKRWAGVAAWEVSDERMAAHLDGGGSGTFDGKTDDGSRIVVSKDGTVDGNVE